MGIGLIVVWEKEIVKMHTISLSHTTIMPIPIPHQNSESCVLSLFKTHLVMYCTVFVLVFICEGWIVLTVSLFPSTFEARIKCDSHMRLRCLKWGLPDCMTDNQINSLHSMINIIDSNKSPWLEEIMTIIRQVLWQSCMAQAWSIKSIYFIVSNYLAGIRLIKAILIEIYHLNTCSWSVLFTAERQQKDIFVVKHGPAALESVFQHQRW